MLEIIFPIHTKLFGRKLVHYPAHFPQYKNFSSLIFSCRAEWQDVDFPTQCTFWSYLIISVVTAHPTHNGMKSFSEEAFSITYYTLHGSTNNIFWKMQVYENSNPLQGYNEGQFIHFQWCKEPKYLCCQWFNIWPSCCMMIK